MQRILFISMVALWASVVSAEPWLVVDTDAGQSMFRVADIDSLFFVDSTMGQGSDSLDVFGLRQFHPTAPGTVEWTSAHWANGNARQISGNDPDDPTGWSERRGSGTLLVDGNGILTMGGSQPRIYINPYEGRTETNPEQFWKNVEVTVYYMRIGSDGANWGGLVVGARSGPNGHSSWGDYCDATTYYLRFRYDGDWDFEKELHHPQSGHVLHDDLWGGPALPSNRWIGMKYIVYNVNDNTNVRLVAYIDSTSNGANGGDWRKVGEYTDAGGWSVDASACAYPDNFIITEGGGVVFIRNTDAAEAHYKWFSVREIQGP
ncbi:MAG: hypothetical protein GF331_16815 [Chitinivibrionales bacterium]|nr:hypothetical protein [Chitinivibrionales bacterium]